MKWILRWLLHRVDRYGEDIKTGNSTEFYEKDWHGENYRAIILYEKDRHEEGKMIPFKSEYKKRR